jgi:tetraacyldisaccharide 4'-kinase
VRIRDVEKVPDDIRKNLYYIPLTIKFLNEEGKDFDRKILNYVTENKSNFDIYSKRNKA